MNQRSAPEEAVARHYVDNGDVLLDLVEQTGMTLGGLGVADYFLFVGRKQA